MIFFVFVLLLCLVPLNGLSLWGFLRFQPAGCYKRACSLFNMATFIIAPVACAGFSLWLHLRLRGNVEEAWLPFLSALGWPAAFPIALLVAGLLRNLVCFPMRPAKPE